MSCNSDVQLALLITWQVCNTATDGHVPTKQGIMGLLRATLTTTGAFQALKIEYVTREHLHYRICRYGFIVQSFQKDRETRGFITKLLKKGFDHIRALV